MGPDGARRAVGAARAGAAVTPSRPADHRGRGNAPATPRTLRIYDVRRARDAGADVLSAVFAIDGRERTLWFRSADVPLAGDADPFFPIGLMLAMRLGTALDVRAPVSPRLARAAAKVQAVMNAWNPNEMRIVPVAVEMARSERAGGDLGAPSETQKAAAGAARGVAAFFTGGTDSSYTLLKHLPRGAQPVYVRGYELRRSDALEGEIAARLRDAAGSLGMRLIEVQSNLRELSDPIVDWRLHAHGAALAGVGLAMAPRFSEVLIGATRSYARLLPSGSHAVLDPLFSNENVEIVHDGAERSRLQKMIWHAADGRALAWLRVCWQNHDGAYNCGRCAKCRRSMLLLRAAGALDRCRTFPSPLALTSRTWVPENVDRDLEEALDYVRVRGGDPQLERVLRKCLTSPPRWHGALQIARRVLRAGAAEREAARGRAAGAPSVERW
jgi:hypothetical protein